MGGSNSGLSLTVPGLVAVLAIVGILVYDGGPLRTLRPPNPGLADQSFSEQTVPARLWQDPFEALERHLKSPPSPAPTAVSDTAPVLSQRDLTAKVWITASPGSDPDQKPGWQAQARVAVRDAQAGADGGASMGAAAPSARMPGSEPRQMAARAAWPPTVLAVVPTVVPTVVHPVVPLMLPGLPLPARSGTAPPMLPLALPPAGRAQAAPARSRLEPVAAGPAETPRETAGQTRILAAMVDGGPYAESAETRLRARHAILAALEVSGYQPVDATHIGVFRPSVDVPPLPGVVPYERLERRNKNDGSVDRVMILWLNGGAFLNEPIARIRALVGQVAADRKLSLPPDEPVVVIGPGSSDGLVAYLREVTAAAGKTGGTETANRGPALVFHSATATASEKSLRAEIGDSIAGATGPSIGCSPGGASESGGAAAGPAGDCKNPRDDNALGVSLWRDTPDDAELAAYLHCELSARGLESRPPRDGVLNWPRKINRGLKCFMTGDERWCKERDGSKGLVVLISEWDSIYGRALPQSVEEELKASRDGPGGEPGTLRCAGGASPDTQLREVRVRRFTYMRGLDGNLPASQGKEETQRAASGASLLPQPRATPPSERAEGQAQLDYLRRLAEQLAEVAKTDGERVFAIGILGSDLHDKMMVLQALRPKFPTTPFFTTDLDARMLDSAYAPAARGLIVASGFSLNPADGDPDLDREGAASIAPFRVSYQTGVYHAVRRAFPSRVTPPAEDPVPSAAPGAASDARPQAVSAPRMDARTDAGSGALPDRVRLYEIGRRGPILLAPLPVSSGNQGDADRGAGPSGAARAGDPAVDPGGRKRPAVDWLVTGFWFAWTLAGVWLVYQRGSKGFAHAHPLGVVGGLLLAPLLAWGLWSLFADSRLACPLHRGPECLETLQVLDGTSAWIPIYLTFAALVLSIVFIVGLLMVRALTLRVIERHYLQDDGDAAGSNEAEEAGFRENLSRDWDRLRGLPRRLLDRVRRWPAPGGAVDAPAGPSTPSSRCAGAEARRSAVCLWASHRRHARWYRYVLVPALAVLFWLFVSSLFQTLGGLGGGTAAVRGLELRGLVGDLRSLSTLAAIILVFLYLDLAAGARGLIAGLGMRTVQWPDAVRARYGVSAPGGDPALADRLIGLRVAARYADLAVRAAGYPLVVLLLLVAARLPWFDTMALPRPVLVTVVVLAFYLLLFAWLVQHAARRLRGEVLGAYQDRLRELRATEATLEQRRELRQLIERVEKMNDFAFKPLAENPLLKVAILPFGTLGLGLLDLLGA